MKTKQTLNQHKDYIKFLEKRLSSKNYKKNISPEEYEKTEAKLKRAKLVLKVLEK